MRLGAAYDPVTGELITEGGVVTAATDYITIADLGITNPAGVRGDVHQIVAGLMGGGLNGTLADAAPIWDRVTAQAHDVTGSTGHDRYAGTAFGDTVRGMSGDDTLLGAGGRDQLDGGAGDDFLTGGRGRDRFVFVTAGEADGDTIRDFATGQDRIVLTRIDANTQTAGNQAFDFIDTAAFSGTAGELRLHVRARQTIVQGDTDGDGLADFQIILNGPTTAALGDFGL